MVNIVINLIVMMVKFKIIINLYVLYYFLILYFNFTKKSDSYLCVLLYTQYYGKLYHIQVHNSYT